MRPHGKPQGSTRLSCAARCKCGFSRREIGEMYRQVDAYIRKKQQEKVRRN
jgi:hypothetical protein